jgi:hypothetical protein
LLARIKGSRKLFACDSFEGLREKFENADVGTFACKAPNIPGVELVKGYFEQSLTPELSLRVGRVAFAHLDADLYSSTICALNWLTPLLDTGSILVFDEFLGEKESEKRAFDEWLSTSGVQALAVAEFARNPSGFGTEETDVRMIFQIVGKSSVPSLRTEKALLGYAAHYLVRAKQKIVGQLR